MTKLLTTIIISSFKMRITVMLIECSIFLAIAISGVFTETCKAELFTVHAIFRHGDRTSDLRAMYPNDPNKNVTYYPFGYGELTNVGKMRMYNLGRFLRSRYGEFLGDLYITDLLESHSSDMRRTKMSLQLVHAGLFPPAKTEEEWNPELNWQPIPFDYKTSESDKIFYGVKVCPNDQKYLEEFLKTEEVINMTNSYSETFRYLTLHTGWNITNITGALQIYTTLKTETEWGLKLPEWAKKLYPTVLDEMSLTNFYILSGTKELKQISSGFMLQKIVEELQMKIKGTKDAKLYLYSGHDLNIAAFLETLKIFKPHNPPYGACVLVEVYKNCDNYYVKIFYENYEKIQTGYLKIPGCEENCPWEKFVSIAQQYYLTDEVCGKKIKEC